MSNVEFATNAMYAWLVITMMMYLGNSVYRKFRTNVLHKPSDPNVGKGILWAIALEVLLIIAMSFV